jgi:hypothetical protein
MNKKELNYIKENYFQEDVDLNLLFEMIDQVKESPRDPLLQEQEGGRFSFAIDLPSLTPSEAWGDPDSQDRDQIFKISISFLIQKLQLEEGLPELSST